MWKSVKLLKPGELIECNCKPDCIVIAQILSIRNYKDKRKICFNVYADCPNKCRRIIEEFRPCDWMMNTSDSINEIKAKKL
jgi:hypothetical protein